MGAALELVVVPVVLITLLVFVLLASSVSGPTIFAAAVVIGLVYFAVVKLLRQLERTDLDAAKQDLEDLHRAEREATEERR